MTEDRNPAGRPTPLEEHLAFFQGFLREPQRVASVVPSSRFLKKAIVDVAEVGRASTVVELGPGTGGTTLALMDALPPEGRILAIEIDPEFVRRLGRYADGKLRVHHGDAADLAAALEVAGLPAPDVVVSGIPFSTMDAPSAERTLRAVHDVLRPGGRFVAYQVRDRVGTLGRRIFGPPQVRLELRNVPPMKIYRWDRA